MTTTYLFEQELASYDECLNIGFDMDTIPLTNREKDCIFDMTCPDCGSALLTKIGSFRLEHSCICSYAACGSRFSARVHNHRNLHGLGRITEPKDPTLAAIKLAQSGGVPLDELFFMANADLDLETKVSKMQEPW
jgi:hypothetical protein